MNDNKDHLRALLNAYNAATGLSLELTPFRERVLRHVDRLQIRPEDITAVVCELKRLMGSDPKRYPDSCVLFNNAIANVERLEERAQQLRQRRDKKKKASRLAAAPAPAVPQVSEEDQRKAVAAFRQANRNQGL